MPAVVRKSSLGTGRLFETDYWIILYELLSPLDCNKGVWQPFVAASWWNMSYAITIWLQQQSQPGFVAANVSTWRCSPSNCWLLIQTFGWLAKSNGCKLEKLIQKESIGAQVMAAAELLCPLVIEVMCLVQRNPNTCSNCMFLCLLFLVIQ